LIFSLVPGGLPWNHPLRFNNPGLSPPRYVVESFSLPTFVGFCLLLAIARVFVLPSSLEGLFPGLLK
ncbi:unnamed protein product, partial [Prunus brigantina]